MAIQTESTAARCKAVFRSVALLVVVLCAADAFAAPMPAPSTSPGRGPCESLRGVPWTSCLQHSELTRCSTWPHVNHRVDFATVRYPAPQRTIPISFWRPTMDSRGLTVHRLDSGWPGTRAVGVAQRSLSYRPASRVVQPLPRVPQPNPWKSAAPIPNVYDVRTNTPSPAGRFP
jgi:hypothetical protein